MTRDGAWMGETDVDIEIFREHRFTENFRDIGASVLFSAVEFL